MTPEERYLFDLQGYLIVPGVLTPDEVSRLNQLLDERDLWAEGARREQGAHMNALKIHMGPMLEWGQEFRDLVSDRRLIPYLQETVGEKCRLDHEYAILMKKGAGENRLHGGGTPYDPGQYYHYRNERIYCGLTVFAWALTDSGGDLGGFCGVPGSHKSNIPCPREYQTIEKRGAWLQCPEVPAGSLVIFTEALTHGTLPWQGDHERRSLLYKYNPGHQSFSNRYDRGEVTPLMDAMGQQMLEPPYQWQRELSLPVSRPVKDDYPG